MTTQSQFKTITINGKRVKCRKIKYGEQFEIGDLHKDGSTKGTHDGEWTQEDKDCLGLPVNYEHNSGGYRPITRKAAKPKAKGRVKAWASKMLFDGGDPERWFTVAISYKPTDELAYIPVWTTPRKGHAKK